jgi:2'-5' RNA ligase
MSSIQGSIRAFVAIELPHEVRQSLHDTQNRVAGLLGPHSNALRWARPEGLHLTLQFLGDVPVRLIGLVKESVDKACEGISPFKLQTGGPGVFPNERRPRVLWVGVEGDLEQLHKLTSAVNKELGALGYKPDTTFSPHLTLGRVKGHAGDDFQRALADAISTLKSQKLTEVIFPVEAVTLMQSELRSGGSIYTRLRTIELK